MLSHELSVCDKKYKISLASEIIHYTYHVSISVCIYYIFRGHLPL